MAKTISPKKDVAEEETQKLTTTQVVVLTVIGVIIVLAILGSSTSGPNNSNQSSTDTLIRGSENASTSQESTQQNQSPRAQRGQIGSDETNITPNEISNYLTGVGLIECYTTNQRATLFSTGSGSLWFRNGAYAVLTNRHVITTNYCTFFLAEKGAYDFSAAPTYPPNNNIDAAAAEITAQKFNSNPASELNYSISKLPFCPNDIPIGSPVEVIGYPSSGQGNSPTPNRILSEGIISGQDNTPLQEGLSAPNYFVSAKIDAGNSGGIAISKSSGNLCVLGIPTWIALGEYNTEGIIQNINNVTTKK